MLNKYESVERWNFWTFIIEGRVGGDAEGWVQIAQCKTRTVREPDDLSKHPLRQRPRKLRKRQTPPPESTTLSANYMAMQFDTFACVQKIVLASDLIYQTIN